MFVINLFEIIIYKIHNLKYKIDLQFVPSFRGKPMLYFDNYLYQERNNKESIVLFGYVEKIVKK